MKRNTWQREAVRRALITQEGFVSAQQLHQAMHESGTSIGLATVYRALTNLAEGGAADSIQSTSGEALYRACTPGQHHHHLICRNCGVTVEIEADAVERWAKSVAAQHHFSHTEHVVDVYGLCAECSRREAGHFTP